MLKSSAPSEPSSSANRPVLDRFGWRLLTLVLIEAVFLAVAFTTITPEMYTYDEADYMYAATRGVTPNYLESPTMPFPDFVRIGLGQGRNPQQRANLSEMIRQSGDILFYRHWHGTAYFFALIAAANLGHDEDTTRGILLIIPALAIAIAYFGVLWIIPGMAGVMAALLAAALLAFSNTMFWNPELAPHKLFVLFYLCSLLLLAKLVTSHERRFWYMSLVFAGLAICTLEVAFVLVFTILVCGLVERRALRWNWALALRSAATLAGTVVIIWPGSLWKLSILKAYAFMAYLGAYTKHPWGPETFTETWAKRFLTSPLEWLFIAIAIAAYLSNRDLRRRLRPAYPFLIYGVVMILATLRITTGLLRYALPFQPALDVFTALVAVAFLHQIRPKLAYLGTSGIALALAGCMLYQIHAHPTIPYGRNLELIGYVQEHGWADKSLLVSATDTPVFHYYFPRARLSVYREEQPSQAEIRASKADVIIFASYPIRAQEIPHFP